MLDIRDVTCSYDGAEALSSVSLRIERGESVAFVGPNGSGKSTLLKLVNGVVLPDSGCYSFDGRQIDRKALKDTAFAKSFHQRVGLLFQNSDAQLFCASVSEEVAFGPRQMGLDEAEVDARVRDCMTLLSISHLSARAPWHLSEGEKRRVALASVLSLNPDVLALDEPMNGLDPKTKRSLREVLVSLLAAGKTILCSTHDFAYVEGLFARAVVLSESHTIVRDDSYGAVIADTPFLVSQNIL
jgi:cobalt/nickel transport system ATP-binding protein